MHIEFLKTFGSKMGETQFGTNFVQMGFSITFDSSNISGILDSKWRKLNIVPILCKWGFQKTLAAVLYQEFWI